MVMKDGGGGAVYVSASVVGGEMDVGVESLAMFEIAKDDDARMRGGARDL